MIAKQCTQRNLEKDERKGHELFMQKNDIVTVNIEDMSVNGEGIGHIDGLTLFVKDGIIGDLASVRITKLKKGYGYGRIEKLIAPSADRVAPVCPIARPCGGCQIQELSYEKQLAFKEKKVRQNMERLGGVSAKELDRVMEPIIGMEDPWHYRNKAQFPFGRDKDGRIICGFYAGRTHSIIETTDCPVGARENKRILEAILAYMEENGIEPYDEQTGRGLIRHAMIRTGYYTKEQMVCLVINGKRLPAAGDLIGRLSVIPGMKSICISPNEKRTNVIMGQTYETLWGDGYIYDYIGENKYRISPLSFYQVNPLQTEKLYRTALSYAGLTGKEIVWDLYCGIGTISLFLARQAGQVYGVEIVPAAVEDAVENAKQNGITNVEFFAGAAEKVVPAVCKERAEKADVIVVDPPRKGLDETLIATILQMEPARIVYVSCDSATLARDVRRIREGGYALERVRPVDQFGHGVHVETVALLSKLNTKQHINV